MTIPLTTARLVAALALSAIGLPRLAAQATDTLRLGALQRAAETADQRAGQPGMLDQQSRLRLQSLHAERLPALTLQGQAQHLSDVTSFGGAGGPVLVPEPYHTQYDASAGIQVKLHDPTLGPRSAIETAQLQEASARVRGTLWQRRQLVNEAFFAAQRLEAQGASIDAMLTDLAAQRALARSRVQNGTALASDTLLLDAAIARRRQDRDQVGTDARAWRDVLAELTGMPVPTEAVLALPDLGPQATAARLDLDRDRSRPEYAQFSASADLIATRRDAARAAEQPRLTGFVRGGYGRPGLNQLSRRFDSYYQAGLRVDWSPWNWGTTDRNQAVQDIQSQILASDEAAFTESLRRAATRDLATIARLERALESDDTIIALRTAVLAESRSRFREGVITSAEYVDRETELLAARLDRDSHRTGLTEARARLLTTLGHEVR